MDPLFVHHKTPAIPIYFLQRLAACTLTEFEQAWLNGYGHNELCDQPIIVPNHTGAIGKVLVKKPAQHNLFALGGLYHALPQGTYYLEDETLTTAELFQLVLGYALGAYEFNSYKAHAAQTPHPQLCLPKNIDMQILKAAIDAHYLARTLINRPPNDLTTEGFAAEIKTLAQNYGANIKEWVDQELIEDNFPLIYHVGQGSVHRPRFIELTFGNSRNPALTLVGKGVCFDSGGLDIKPASGMRLMKKDMGGAAHVLALAQWIMAENWPIFLRVLIPIVENSISGSAMRPGDIITARNGLTVEIDNTDAEGRLVLADALTYAQEHPCDLLMDFATLTGAARVALGPELPALFSNNDLIAAKLLENGIKFHDPLWRLPFFEDYEEWIKPLHADLVNSASQPYGGAITAALFLKAFVPKNLPYVHIDVMAWNIRNRVGRPIGGEAMGLRASYYALAHYFNIG